MPPMPHRALNLKREEILRRDCTYIYPTLAFHDYTYLIIIDANFRSQLTFHNSVKVLHYQLSEPLGKVTMVMFIYLFFSHFSFVSFLNLMKAQDLGRNVVFVTN